MKSLRVALFLVIGLAAPAVLADAPVDNAESTISSWLVRLKKKTRPEVEAQLGAPTEVSTWEFQGNKQLKLLYVTVSKSGKRRVEVLFLGETVITVSYQLIP